MYSVSNRVVLMLLEMYTHACTGDRTVLFAVLACSRLDMASWRLSQRSMRVVGVVLGTSKYVYTLYGDYAAPIKPPRANFLARWLRLL